MFHSTRCWHERFHNHHPIEFNSNRGGINLETEKTHDGTTSRLLLTRAQFRDGGNYSCNPLGAIPASGFVHVLNGEWHFHTAHSCMFFERHSNLMAFNAIFRHFFPFFRDRRTPGSKVYERCCTLMLLPQHRTLHDFPVAVSSLPNEKSRQLLRPIELTTVKRCMSCAVKRILM